MKFHDTAQVDLRVAEIRTALLYASFQHALSALMELVLIFLHSLNGQTINMAKYAA